MSADEELEHARAQALEKMKRKLAKRILRSAEEETFPSRTKTCIVWLKVISTIAVFICAPIMGWLITQLANETLSANLFLVYLFPMIFIGIITAIALVMKIPEE